MSREKKEHHSFDVPSIGCIPLELHRDGFRSDEHRSRGDNGRSNLANLEVLRRVPGRVVGRLGHVAERRATNLTGFRGVGELHERLARDGLIDVGANRERADMRVEGDRHTDGESATRILDGLRRSAGLTPLAAERLTGGDGEGRSVDGVSVHVFYLFLLRSFTVIEST